MKIKVLLISLFVCLPIFYSITYAQNPNLLPVPTELLTHTKQILKDSTITLSTKDKEKVKTIVESGPYGDIIWRYFGEVILVSLVTLVYAIRNYITTIVSNVVGKIKNKTTYTNKDIEQLGILNTDINSYLTKIKEVTKARRVLLYQFSNGSHFFSSIPVLRMTVTNYSDGDNVKITDNVFNYATAKEIVHQILNDEYLEITDTTTDNKYCGYVSYLRFANFKYSTILRLTVADNYCGAIELIEPEEFDLPSVRSYSLSIGHLFERYSKNRE